MLFQLHNIAQEIKDKDFSTNIEINALLKKTPKDLRRLPMSFNLTNSGTLKKLTNIGNAEKLNIDNNGGVINQNFVFVTLDNKTFFAPEKSEFYGRDYFEKMFNLQTQILEKFDAFEQKIKLWKKRLELYAEELKKLPNNDPRKKEGFEVLKNYKKNIDIATSLSKDFSEETKVVEDNNGNKNYLINLENLKNDPRYFFIGKEIEGFSVAKKFNKYGYISHSKKFKDIPFKYDFCSDFKYDYALVSDQNFTHIIDKNGHENYTFETTKFVKITSISNGVFSVVEKKDFAFHDNDYYFISNSGKVLTKKYFSLEPLNDSKKYFKGEFLAPSHSENKNRGIIFTSEELINNKGKIIFSDPLNCSIFFPEIENNSCLINIINIIELPETDKLLYICNFNSQKEPSFIIIKDMEQKNNYQNIDISIRIKKYDNVSFSNIKNMLFSSSENKKNILLEMSFSKKEIDVIYIKNDTILKRWSRSSGYMNEKNFTIKNKLDIQRKAIYNLLENKIIGKDFLWIPKVDYSKKIIFISNEISYNEKSEKAFGIMNFNGLFIIPPIFKEIKYNNNENIFEVFSFNNSSYAIDIYGTCVENCKEYNLIIKNYYAIINMSKWSGPIPFKR